MKTCNEIKMGAIARRCFTCHVVIYHSVGSRGGARGPRLPLIFRPNLLRLEGPKKIFSRPGPPLSQCLDERGPPLSEGLDPPLYRDGEVAIGS